MASFSEPDGTVGADDGRDRVPLAQRMALLSRIQAFAGLPVSALERLASLMQEVQFPAGHVIVREGEIGDRLFVLVEGHVVAATTHDTVLARLESGSLFGELALISADKVRHATVTATDDVLVLTLTDTALAELIRVYPRTERILKQTRMLRLLQKTWHLQVLYRLTFTSARRERNFLASVAFLVTFALVRWIVRAISAGKGPFRDVSRGGVHIHHLVWGILLLLVVGYAWLMQVGTGLGSSRLLMRETAIFYGIGSALTLDEFALWLHLKDVYALPEGRISIDAVILFGALLSVGVWGEPFWKAVYKYLFERDTAKIPI
jgi:CRP-like cAMP-binding protein